MLAGKDDRDAGLVAYVERLLHTAAAARLPALFSSPPPSALYRSCRGGVSTVALRAADLATETLVGLLRFRLGQYVHPEVNAVNVGAACAAGLEHEPLSDVSPGDVYFAAGCPETGEVLGCAVLWSLPGAHPGTTLRLWERPLFPVERAHGWGIFNRLQHLPDQPLEQVREFRHFVRNQSVPLLDERSARAQIELGAAVIRSLLRPLRGEVAALIGDEDAARDSLQFFGCPLVQVKGTVPYADDGAHYAPRYRNGAVYPFGALAGDLAGPALDRLDTIEEVLSRPHHQALAGLFQMQTGYAASRSSLEPPEGLAPLTSAELPQHTVGMAERRQILDVAERLRSIDAFLSLSDGEARILAGFLAQTTVPAGEVVIRQGDASSDLFLIEAGQAEVRVTRASGDALTVGRLGPGDHFGEIALVSGGRRTADVVAKTPLTLLVLSKAAYTEYLTRVAEVESEIARTAGARASDTVRQVSTEDQRAAGA